VVFELRCEGDPLRTGLAWAQASGEALTGLGARHGLAFDQVGRTVRLGADRRYTGPDCPEDMLEVGGIPMGDYSPAPWLVSSEGWAVWVETTGAGCEFDLADRVAFSVRPAAGPLRARLLCDSSPAAALRRYCRLSGLPGLLPEWAYGHWKSRDVYEHERDVLDDLDGYVEHDLPLDAIVIDSPWETQYNTWEFNTEQFPDPPGLIRRLRSESVRTVVWVTPWVNLDSSEGQRPPDPVSERMHREPAPNYAEGAEEGHFVRRPDGEPHVARWWMGTGSIVDFTSEPAREWWKRQAARALALGVEGIKADDGEGYYFPPDVRFADGRTGAEVAWEYGALYRQTMQEVLDEVHPGTGVLFGRSGWTGQQSVGILWGGDQASDFWSLRTLVAATLTAAMSGFSNWSHDVGGYLGRRLVERCPAELLARWVQFGCFTPLMQAHGRFAQEAWRYDSETLDLYREYVVLHERLVPYIRAAAATAARCGVPITRPLPLIDPGDRIGWQITDAYGFGPSLWVAPVVDEAARARTVHLPRGGWIDFWTRERLSGGGTIVADAPLARIPVWVREGSILLTHPASAVRAGLGLDEEHRRPLEATLWGRPKLGHAAARLADGTKVSWREGEWVVPEGRDIAVAEV
jgi:alpha-glucosidase (family GH31 glycosyl hydrolase)